MIEDYTKIVDDKEIKSSKSDTTEDDFDIYTLEKIYPTSSSIQPEKIEQSETAFVRALRSKLKLAEYLLGTDTEVIEEVSQTKSLINNCIDKIIKLFEDLEDNLSDPIEVEIIFSNIINLHKQLWALRNERNETFSQVLVLLESVLKYYDINEFTETKLKTLKIIYTDLKSTCLLSDYPDTCSSKLSKAGFDILRPFNFSTDSDN